MRSHRERRHEQLGKAYLISGMPIDIMSDLGVPDVITGPLEWMHYISWAGIVATVEVIEDYIEFS